VEAERAPVAAVDIERFLSTVERRLHTDRPGAQQAVAATLETLAERLSPGEVRDLVEQLPLDLSVWLLTDHTEPFDVDEFLQRVAKRENVDIRTAEWHARTVLAVVREAIPPDEVADLLSDLPEDFRPIVLNLAIMPLDTFVHHVAEATDLEPDAAVRAVEAVLQTLAERLPAGEVDDLKSKLPVGLHAVLSCGADRADHDTRTASAEAFVRHVATREGASLREATRHTRAVLETLRDAIGVEEFSDIVAELPKDYDPMLPRP
jgi:uncharacterized protein (DUF2267 family)